MDQKYEVMIDGTVKAPFETEAEVVAYRLEHQDAIAAYNAGKISAAQPVSRDTPTELGAMLLDIKQPEPEPTGLNAMAKMLFDSQAMRIADTIKVIKQTQPAVA